MPLRVLTWNVMHGRAVPPAGRELLSEFSDALAGWQWDVALLQEVPPWWPAALGSRLRASALSVLTSRNSLLVVRRLVATRWPDLIKSNGGGCNAILVRGRSVVGHRVARVSWLPERRWVHAVRLECGTWIGNVHGGGRLRECARAAQLVRRWAGDAPAVLGGDFNVRFPVLGGFAWAGGCKADHVLVRGLSSAAYGYRVLERGSLSDHVPVLVGLGEL
jgi:endonuclease/exonuclease/phosphatase family metal-dependent hydrolase